MAGFDSVIGQGTRSETTESKMRAHLMLADATDLGGKDIKTLAGDIHTQADHFLNEKTSLLAQAKETLMGAGGIQAALPAYDKAIAEAKTIDQKMVKAEMDEVTRQLAIETDPGARRILTQEQADLDDLQRLPAMALANKGLAEKHHNLAQGEQDIAAARVLDPKMDADARFQERYQHVQLDLASSTTDDSVVRHLSLPRNFNTSMSPVEQSKWLAQLPANLSAQERKEQDQYFRAAIAVADSVPSTMLTNAQHDVARAQQALRTLGIETDPTKNPQLKDISDRADALIKTLPSDQQNDAALKYSLYTRAINDEQRTSFRGQLTAINGDFGPKMSKILDEFDAAYHLKPSGNAGGNPFFALNQARQKVENEANQTAVTRVNYAEVLAARGDKDGAQRIMKEAIGHNHSANLAIFLRKLATSPDIGLTNQDVDAIPVTITASAETGDPVPAEPIARPVVAKVVTGQVDTASGVSGARQVVVDPPPRPVVVVKERKEPASPAPLPSSETVEELTN